MTQKYVNYFLNNCRNIPTTNTNQGKNSSRTKGDTSREVEGQLTLMRHENLEHALRVLVPVQRLEEGEKPNYSWPHWGRVELRWLPWDKWRPHSLNQVHKYRIIDDFVRGGARGTVRWATWKVKNFFLSFGSLYVSNEGKWPLNGVLRPAPYLKLHFCEPSQTPFLAILAHFT